MPNSANANCGPIIWSTHAAHVPCPAVNRWDCKTAGVCWGGANGSQITRKANSIDLAKSVKTDATSSQLWQTMDPPLGSDLH